jgi:hypothetical protein
LQRESAGRFAHLPQVSFGRSRHSSD